jgi:hypothetical protein
MNAPYARSGRLEEGKVGEITAAYEDVSERLVALAHLWGRVIGGPSEAA